MKAFTVSSSESLTPKFARSTGTVDRKRVTRNREDAPKQPRQKPTNLAEWKTSKEAKRLEGSWVLLSDNFDVVDHSTSPSELLDRNPEERTPRVVFVERSNTNLIV